MYQVDVSKRCIKKQKASWERKKLLQIQIKKSNR